MYLDFSCSCTYCVALSFNYYEESLATNDQVNNISVLRNYVTLPGSTFFVWRLIQEIKVYWILLSIKENFYLTLLNIRYIFCFKSLTSSLSSSSSLSFIVPSFQLLGLDVIWVISDGNRNLVPFERYVTGTKRKNDQILKFVQLSQQKKQLSYTRGRARCSCLLFIYPITWCIWKFGVCW